MNKTISYEGHMVYHTHPWLKISVFGYLFYCPECKIESKRFKKSADAMKDFKSKHKVDKAK